MNTICIESEIISIHNTLLNRTISVPVYGIADDEIAIYQEFSISIKRLILKMETELNTTIKSINIICNIGKFEIHKQGRIGTTNMQKGKTITNKFEMQACNAFEVFDETHLKKVINSFTEIGIVVEKIYSPFGLFIQNAKTQIKNQPIAIVNFTQKQTQLCIFDGAGSIANFTTYNFGFNKCLEYIIQTTVARFPYLKKNQDAILLVVQNFINLSEFEMMAKISKNKQYKKEVIALVNYEMARFISEKIHQYYKQIWDEINIPDNIHTAFITSNTKYTKTLTLICDLVATQHILPLNSLLKIEHETRKNQSIWKEIIGLVKSA